MGTLSTSLGSAFSKNFAIKLQQIEKEGAQMMAREYDRIQSELDAMDVEDPLSYLMALGTVWSDYAEFSEGYMESAASFINGGAPLENWELSEAALHKGAFNLKLALQGYRTLRNRMRNKNFDFETASLETLVRAYNYFHSVFQREKESGKFEGFGPWLFGQVFFIILIYRKDLWENIKAPSHFVFPTGKKVLAHLRQLKKAGYPIPMDQVPSDYKEAANHDHMTHAAIEQLAIQYHLNPLELNAGFFIAEMPT
jgi:hypothetical protein